MAATSEPNGLSRTERELWVSLKYHLEALAGERQRLIELQFREHYKEHQRLDEGVKVALASQDRRLDLMNEPVNRELFDVVANRLTVVENTYLTRIDYGADNQAKEKRDLETTRIREAAYNSDHDALGEKVSALERAIIGRETFGALAEKVNALERTTVTQNALDSQRRESERSRRAMTVSLVAVGAAAILNFAINLYQGAHGTG